MINIVDNFLGQTEIDGLYERLIKNEFVETIAGDKNFYVQYPEPWFEQFLLKKISELEGVERKSVLSFFRAATDQIDNDWRIHCDSIINNQRPTRALVLYVSPSGLNSLNGTAFWEHKLYGHSMPKDVSFEEFDKVLLEDSNNLDKWNLSSVVGYKQDRAVMYPCEYFHSKYPNMSWPDGRIVYVMFYL